MAASTYAAKLGSQVATVLPAATSDTTPAWYCPHCAAQTHWNAKTSVWPRRNPRLNTPRRRPSQGRAAHRVCEGEVVPDERALGHARVLWRATRDCAATAFKRPPQAARTNRFAMQNAYMYAVLVFSMNALGRPGRTFAVFAEFGNAGEAQNAVLLQAS